MGLEGASANSTGVLERERDRVAAASRMLADRGLVLGSAGNVSERAGELVAITPTGAVLATVTAEQISVVDLAGSSISGPAPTSELQLHLGVYARYDAGGVVHTHAPVGTALSCVLDEVPALHYAMVLFGGSVRVAPYRTFGTSELAHVTLDALADRSAALMANHGTITYGSDLDGAVERSLLLEWACELYWRAASIGTPRALDEAQLMEVVNVAAARSYGVLKEAEE
ncbi:MAG TPA: class II aldolase/adducin family protein [Solirubrobacteraceae bacterium]